MKSRLVCVSLVLMILATSFQDVARGFAFSERARPSAPEISPPSVLPAGNADGVEIGTGGGIVDLPDGGDITIPQGALQTTARFSRYSVEMNQAGGLRRYHPLAQAIRIEAKRSDNGARITSLQQAATVRLKLTYPVSPSQTPAVRMQSSTGWDLISSSYDQTAQTLTVSLSSLPATLAIVDDSLPPGSGDWDPSDPAAIEMNDGSWGVVYTDATNPAHTLYRRYLGNSDPPYWLDAVTVDTGASQYDTPVPALVRSGSILALFYRKATGNPSVKQAFLRTSTDDGINWSSATQLTTESADVYQIQAQVVSNTVYLFFSLSNTSGTLQYITASTSDLSSWSGKTTVGQAIGTLQNNTYPSFDIKQLSSGTWGLTWLDPGIYCLPWPLVEPCTSADRNASNSTHYPAVWYASSTVLTATTWSNKKDITLPWANAWPNGLSIAQTSGGTVYLSYTRSSYPAGSRSRYNYYATSANDGAGWSGMWSNATLYGYDPDRDTGVWSGSSPPTPIWSSTAAAVSGRSGTRTSRTCLRDRPELTPPSSSAGTCRPAA